MYENGKRVSGYHKKRQHKRRQKNDYARTWSYGKRASGMDWKALQIYVEQREKDISVPAHVTRYDLDYWRYYDISDRKKYAKRETARRARQQFREAVNRCADLEEFEGLDPYHRLFDYNWEVW